jgi:hypothetical protein
MVKVSIPDILCFETFLCFKWPITIILWTIFDVQSFEEIIGMQSFKEIFDKLCNLLSNGIFLILLMMHSNMASTLILYLALVLMIG